MSNFKFHCRNLASEKIGEVLGIPKERLQQLVDIAIAEQERLWIETQHGPELSLAYSAIEAASNLSGQAQSLEELVYITYATTLLMNRKATGQQKERILEQKIAFRRGKGLSTSQLEEALKVEKQKMSDPLVLFAEMIMGMPPR